MSQHIIGYLCKTFLITYNIIEFSIKNYHSEKWSKILPPPTSKATIKQQESTHFMDFRKSNRNSSNSTIQTIEKKTISFWTTHM